MGICNKENQKINGNNPLYISQLNNNKQEKSKPVPLETAIKLSKSICKIIYKDNLGIHYGTGFFMIYNSLKCLISNYHVINHDLINKFIKIEIYNKNTIDFKLDQNRYIKILDRPIDISIIEIKDSDGIKGDIEYLNYDLNYKFGYSQYKGVDIIGIEYPLGKDVSCGSGKIINIHDFCFDHNIPTQGGSSGTPIILFNTLKVIGIHKGGNTSQITNAGTFIGEIFNEVNKILEKKNVEIGGIVNTDGNKEKENYI